MNPSSGVTPESSVPAVPGAAPVAAAGAAEKNRYRASLNLPNTPFAMKANLVQNEPASLKRWQAMGLYKKIRAAASGKPRFVFHDGPPYANGSIHLGHLMNKCLKDIVVRSRTMMGFDCPFVPGWDCHGLPIEHKVMTELVEKGKMAKLGTLTEDQRRTAIRRECQAYAEKYIKLQSGQMQRLLTLADYENPYLTMQPGFEGATLEVLAGLMEQGLVYRAVKPVHWSIANETALAEAELEYYDREDISVYVDFEALDADSVYDAFGMAPASDDDEEDDDESEGDSGGGGGEGESGDRVPVWVRRPGMRPTQRPCFMIWTTTPWTLPANVAVAVNPEHEYALVYIDGNVTVLAAKLVDAVAKLAGAESVVILARTTGARLVGLRYKHPFVTQTPKCALQQVCSLNKVWSVVSADYVTLEDGTGLVHTAPGHGAEDYATGLREALPVYCPVRANGTYDDTVPDWLRGLDIWKANELVTRHLRDSGHLFHDHKFMHSYPHDWRSKTPVIFRCTEQWFISVDDMAAGHHKSLRALAMEAVATETSRIDFVPEWGRNRMRGMIESRPDWCISRQRAWGLPIPAFLYKDESGETQAFMTPATIRAVAKLIREKGADVWFSASPEELLQGYAIDSDSHAPEAIRKPGAFATLRKGPDILDVWFESGSTWNAVMRERNLGFPIDLYLEGSDQHRGWFQSSLFPALGVTGRPPFKTLLTHGFIVDKDGKKLSKSRPDASRYEVDSLCSEFGMDVMRWWVSSLPYENDIKADLDLFASCGQSYVKIRNTIRFLLSNLADFKPSVDGKPGGHCVDLKLIQPASLDAWVLEQFDRLAAQVHSAYDRYDLRTIHLAIFDFCNDTLSATYLAAVKDRLYCDPTDSARRRQTQTVLWELADGLCRLLAPIMCHTADEAYRSLHKVEAKDETVCVHLTEFIRHAGGPGFGVRADSGWDRIMALRTEAQGELERAKEIYGVKLRDADPKTGVVRERLQFDVLDFGLALPDPEGTLAGFDVVELADLMGVSRVVIDREAARVRIIDLRAEPQCERSWKRDGTVRQRSDGGMLSDRDAAAVGVA